MNLLSIALSIVLALAPTDAKQGESDWDAVLNQYELVCDLCLEKKSIKEIRLQTDKLNGMLSQTKGNMTKEQITRFEHIKSKYSNLPGIVLPSTKEKTVIVDTIHRYEHVHVTDTVYVKEILASIDFNQNFSSKDTVVHIVKIEEAQKAETVPVEPSAQSAQLPEEKSADRAFIIAGTTVPSSPRLGLTLGYGADAGAWISYSSNYKSIDHSYSISGINPSIWTTGQSRLKTYSICAGAYSHIWNNFGAYAGAGYGEYLLYWEDIDGEWARIEAGSTTGFSYRAGIAFCYKHLLLSGGVSGIMNRLDFELGIGIRF